MCLEVSRHDGPSPSQVRTYILTEHHHLRRMIDAVEESALSVIEQGHVAVDLLIERASLLHTRLLSHMERENEWLAPALAQTDCYGPERARLLLAEHDEQRSRLDASLGALAKADAPLEQATAMLALVQWLRRDMEEEERELLNDQLLRDDILTVDMYTG